MKQLPKALRAALVALALLTVPARAEKTTEQGMLPDPVELLKPYYSALQPQISLPQAGPNPALPAQTTVHRLAFGSCEYQSYPQAFWNAIGDADPQLFLMLGDNVYGDLLWNGGADLGSLRTAYAKLAGHTEFAAFRSMVPMMETWDDHDFGFNDGGSAFAFREWSETIFEHFWNAGEAVRSRPGVYDSAIFGEEGKRLQVILLDTRFFRSPFQLLPADAQPSVHGPYRPDDTPELEMLGEAQWAWLQ
jgi:alkaline phosphatase D